MKSLYMLSNDKERMRSLKFSLLILLIMVTVNLSDLAQADESSSTIDLFQKSDAVKPFFKNAYGYAVFPTVGKAGLVVGGAYGKGKVYQAGKVAGITTVTRLSIGWQAGGQVFSEIIFFQDKRAYDDFTRGNFEFDAQASAVAITAGAQASAGTEGTTAGASTGSDNAKQAENRYRNGMAVFVHVEGGLMYEAAIGGQKFGFTPGKE